jgi:hypothetical protein
VHAANIKHATIDPTIILQGPATAESESVVTHHPLVAVAKPQAD